MAQMMLNHHEVHLNIDPFADDVAQQA